MQKAVAIYVWQFKNGQNILMGSKTTHITLFFSIVSGGTKYPMAKPIKVDFIIVAFVHIQLAPFSEKRSAITK